MAQARTSFDERITDPVIRELFNRSFERISAVHEFNVRRTSQRREIDHGRAQLDTQLDSYSEMLAGARNPAEFAQIADQARAAISRAQQTGLITEVDAGNRQRAFLSRATEVTIRQRMLNEAGLDQLYRDLLNPQMFRDLDERRRVELTAMVQSRANTLRHERVAAADRNERRAERQLRAIHDANEITLYSRMMLNNPPTATELVIAAQNGQISREALERLNRARLIGNEGRTDPETLFNLINFIHTRPGEESRRQIFEQMSAGRLSVNDMQTLTNMTHTVEGRDFSTSEQRFYHDRIRDDLGAANPFAITREDSANYARASIEYYERIRAGERPQDVYQDISRRYRQIEPSPAQLPIPRGSTSRPQNIAELQEAIRRLRAMYEARQITDADYNRELGNLQEWQRVLSRRQSQ
jgi:hypothetical protein